ncbi:MAG: alpha/beta hydrolase [Bdellovibrionota bacterium]
MPVNLSFKTQGHGPDLILLHGYAGRPQALNILTDSLSPYFRVVVPDLTDLYINRKKWSFCQQVEMMNEWIRARVNRPYYDVLGMSYGGALAWGLSLQHPDLINKLILVNPMGSDPFQSIRYRPMSFFMRLPNWKPISHAFLATSAGKTFLLSAKEIFRDTRLESLDVTNLHGKKLAFVAGLISQFGWILNQENWSYWRDRLPENTKESLMIYDRRDPLFHESSYEDFAQLFGVQEHFHIDGAGHIPHPRHYSLIADSVLSFLMRDKLGARFA